MANSTKKSIKMKNKLFVNTNKGDDIQQKNVYYKIYRNKLNHLMRTAERNHYQDLIIQHKSIAKKSWQIIKLIIDKRKYTPANEERRKLNTARNALLILFPMMLSIDFI